MAGRSTSCTSLGDVASMGFTIRLEGLKIRAFLDPPEIKTVQTLPGTDELNRCPQVYRMGRACTRCRLRRWRDRAGTCTPMGEGAIESGPEHAGLHVRSRHQLPLNLVLECLGSRHFLRFIHLYVDLSTSGQETPSPSLHGTSEKPEAICGSVARATRTACLGQAQACPVHGAVHARQGPR